MNKPAAANRAGNVIARTELVISRFGIENPEFLADVCPRLSDIMIGEDQLITLKETDSLGNAQDTPIENRVSFFAGGGRDRRGGSGGGHRPSPARS
jgi:hypothetical protein